MTHIFRIDKTHIALFLGSLFLSNCVLVARSPTRIETTIPPPEPPVEHKLACLPGYAYMPGHWRWNGQQYFWIPQRCKYRPGFQFNPGGYYQCGDGYCYRKGEWLRMEEKP